MSNQNLRMAKFKHLNPTSGEEFPTAGDIVQPDTLFVYPIGTGIMKMGVSDGVGVFLGNVRQEELLLHNQRNESGEYLYEQKSPDWYFDTYGEGVIIREMIPKSSLNNAVVNSSRAATVNSLLGSYDTFLLQTTILYARNSININNVIAEQIIESEEYGVKIVRGAFGFMPEAWQTWGDKSKAFKFDFWERLVQHLTQPTLEFTDEQKKIIKNKLGIEQHEKK